MNPLQNQYCYWDRWLNGCIINVAVIPMLIPTDTVTRGSVPRRGEDENKKSELDQEIASESAVCAHI